MPTLKRASLLLLLFTACATPRRASPVAAAPPALPVSASPAPPEPPAYRGRVTTSVGDAGAADAGTTNVWTDVIVPGNSEAHQRACETVLGSQQWFGTNFLTNVQSHVARACSLDPLPAPAGAAAYVLVETQDPATASFAAVLAHAGRGDSTAVKDVDVPITVTTFWRFPSEATCEQARAQRLDRLRQQQVAASESAQKWLADELANQEKNRDDVCRRQRELESRCATLRGARPPNVQRACKGRPDSDRCAEAQERASELEGCKLFPGDLARGCANAEALVKVTRDYVPKPSQPATVPPPVCRRG